MSQLQPIVVLSSHNSTYGAQVLKALHEHDLLVTCVVVEQAAARGGRNRAHRYLKKYGFGATGFRLLEFMVSQFARRLQKVPPLPTVEDVAQAFGIPVLPVHSHNDPEAQTLLAGLQPALGILGGTRILSSATINQFSGSAIINVHAGILPEYRGNYANRWALFLGGQTGITAYTVQPKLDCGPILECSFIERQTSESLIAFEDRITATSAGFVADVAGRYLSGKVMLRPQILEQGREYGLMPLRVALRLHVRLWLQDLRARRGNPEATGLEQ